MLYTKSDPLVPNLQIFSHFKHFFMFLWRSKTLNRLKMIKHCEFRNFAQKHFVRHNISNTIVFFIIFSLHFLIFLILERGLNIAILGFLLFTFLFILFFLNKMHFLIYFLSAFLFLFFLSVRKGISCVLKPLKIRKK